LTSRRELNESGAKKNPGSKNRSGMSHCLSTDASSLDDILAVESNECSGRSSDSRICLLALLNTPDKNSLNGVIQRELTAPSHLPSSVYQLQHTDIMSESGKQWFFAVFVPGHSGGPVPDLHGVPYSAL
jgi:hypothetical protein